MARIAVVYASVHKGNTKTLLYEAQKILDFDILAEDEFETTDLSKYKAVGFASGVYKGKLHKRITNLAFKSENIPHRVFVIATCGSGNKKYAKQFADDLRAEKGYDVVGSYTCRGYDTVFPFKLFGGLSKGHPDKEDIDKCVVFLRCIKDDA